MATQRPYHHGDLDRALKEAAIALISEQGPAGFSLREVARRAGVSHAAPAHHFGDSRGLLTALAIDGFHHLAAELAAARASTDDPREQFIRLGVAYVRVGLERPAHAALVFRKDLVDADNRELQHWGLTSYGELEEAVTALRDRFTPELDVPNAARLAWASMQGLLELQDNFEHLAALGGGSVDDPLRLAETFARMLLRAFTAG